MAEPSLVRNAADPKQVRFAERFEKRRQQRLDQMIGAVMSTAEGRALMKHLLTDAGLYRELWRPGAEVHYAVAQHDFAVQTRRRLKAVSEKLVLLMEQEDLDWSMKIAAEIEGAHASRANTKGDDDGG
jgi:hypothetical protein